MTEPNIFHPVNRSRNPNSREKVSSCQSNQSLRKHPPSAAADTTANYHDGDAAKLLKFMSRAAKMDVVTALMAIWRAPRNCLIHFLFLWPHSPLRSAGTRGREEGWGRGGERSGGRASGAVNCAGVLIRRCNVHTGLMLQQQRRYVRCGDFCDSCCSGIGT